jgi:alpha-D-ribose 1-methylphosphonate 5-triphosphate diphosphatase
MEKQMPLDVGSTQNLAIHGGLCLIPGEGLVPADIHCSGGVITGISRRPDVAKSGINASGCLVLPGIVDIHGDAFERQIMPRPKTMFPLEIALLETDRQLAANGITTAYHGITVSWEPGLRSLEQAMRIINALDKLEPDLHSDNRLHIRWETFAIDEAGDVKALFRREKKPLLAFNDHTSMSLSGTRKDIKLRGSAERAMVDMETYRGLLDGIGERQGEVADAIKSMSASAQLSGVPMLSHDDCTVDMRQFYRDLGAMAAEFPMNIETLADAAANGDHIVLGSPNVVRGGSHNGAIAAEDAIREEMCTILASDYYYPAPLAAALSLVHRKVLPLDRAWDLVSGAPARACGLMDRGSIAVGMRADLIVLPELGRRPSAVLSKGSIVYSAP